MHINRVRIKGFRNFKDAEINFSKKSLIIGGNDIGKSNLLYALRILLDRSLSDADLEPLDSDFYIHENTNEIEIYIEFNDINEDCVLSKLRERVSDDGTLLLAYRAKRDPRSYRIEYGFLAGPTETGLEEIDSRFYLKVLNLKYIGSKRDLITYIRQERKRLLQDARIDREDDEINEDNKTLEEIESRLNEVHHSVNDLSYVRKATARVNTELGNLSFHNTNQDIVFDTGASDPSLFVGNLKLSSRVGEKTVTVGGDGRNNQIHLALWAARNNPQSDQSEEPPEVSLFCIEEPEIHLHPHQQRKLAEYLSETLDSQVIITTHSPQITCAFPPACIIRLYNNQPDTLAAGNGKNPFTETAFIDFGHRLNIIPAEAFFSDMILLVEGVSEELFYKALAREIGIDLDRYNISVLMVDGIGFKPFISLLSSLKIAFVARTDNDIFKVPYKQQYRFAGLQRAIDIYQTFFNNNIRLDQFLQEHAHKLEGFPEKQPPEESLKAASQCASLLEQSNIFIADIDLEHDLHAALGEITSSFFGTSADEETIRTMQKKKGVGMFSFLKMRSDSLRNLSDQPLAKPLQRCKSLVEAQYA